MLKPGTVSKTYIVFHHPEDVSESIVVGNFFPVPAKLCKGGPHLFHNLFLMGGNVGWCEKHFFGQNDTLGLESFFQFIESNPPTPVCKTKYVER